MIVILTIPKVSLPPLKTTNCVCTCTYNDKQVVMSVLSLKYVIMLSMMFQHCN